MTVSEAFGITIRKLRVDRRISQEGLATRCNLDRTFISLLERGLRQPTLSTIFKFSKALQVPAPEIVRQTDRTLSKKAIKGAYIGSSRRL